MNSKLRKGCELFNNDAYKKCVDEYKNKHGDISSSKIAELSQRHLEEEIPPKMIERLYKSEVEQLIPERINCLQQVFEELLSLPKNSLIFRKNPPIYTSNPNVLLNDIQTKNLIDMHLNSIGYLIFIAAEKIINSSENHDKQSFHQEFRTILSDSRILCNSFESQTLGDVMEFLENNFDDDLSSQYADIAYEKIICSKKEKSIKTQQLIAFVKEKQNEIKYKVNKALNNNYICKPLP